METDKRVGCNLLYIGTCMEANQDASVHRIFHQQLFWYRHRHLRLLAFRLLCPLNAALNLVSCLSSMSLKIVTLRKRSVTVMANMTHCHHSKMSHFKSLSLWKMLRMQYGYWVLVTGHGSGMCSYIQVSVCAVKCVWGIIHTISRVVCVFLMITLYHLSVRFICRYHNHPGSDRHSLAATGTMERLLQGGADHTQRAWHVPDWRDSVTSDHDVMYIQQLHEDSWP